MNNIYAIEKQSDAHLDRQEQLQAAYESRLEALMADDEALSEAIQDLDCLTVRGERRFASGFGCPAITTGTEMFAAYRAGDWCEMGRILKDEIDAKLAAEAEA